jgi:hypothetical protein
VPGTMTQAGMRRAEVVVQLLVVLSILAAVQAFGEVYTWKDTRGVDHYANRKDDIPVRYRSDAKSLEYDREPKAAGLPSADRNANSPDRSEARTPGPKEQEGTSRTRRRKRSGDEEE